MSGDEWKPGLRTCIEKGCGNAFILTEKDIARYKANGWDLPLRCQSCRDKRRREGLTIRAVGAD